jgi:hypothetical protein
MYSTRIGQSLRLDADCGGERDEVTGSFGGSQKEKRQVVCTPNPAGSAAICQCLPATPVL